MLPWVIMIDEIRQRLEARPFEPFTVYVADGREYLIPSAGHAHIHPNGMRVSVWTDDNRQYTLPLRQLSGVLGSAEMPEPPEPAD